MRLVNRVIYKALCNECLLAFHGPTAEEELKKHMVKYHKGTGSGEVTYWTTETIKVKL